MGEHCILIGKIDGIVKESKQVIEVKHRQNHLFHYVPVYEKVRPL